MKGRGAGDVATVVGVQIHLAQNLQKNHKLSPKSRSRIVSSFDGDPQKKK
jgi:hypothetical protein